MSRNFRRCDEKERMTVTCLILTDAPSDFTDVLETCGVATERMTMEEAVGKDLSPYDAFCILACGKILDPRLRVRLEEENGKGKRIFTEALNSWGGIYSAEGADTTRLRLAVVNPADGEGIPGLETGDLLDDEGNRSMRPWYGVPGMMPILVYREHVMAHRHWNADREEILKDGTPGLWTIGDTVMMCSFEIHNFNRARFAPREAWRRLIVYIARWITGQEPASLPEPVIHYGPADADLSNDAAFERCRLDAVERGIRWLRGFLVDDGRGGIREGLRHPVDPDGHQASADSVRTDCTGEAAGAFRFHALLTGDEGSRETAENLAGFVFGPMEVSGGPFDGMLRWTDTAWQVCYQDDAARAMLPALYECLLTGRRDRFPDVCRALDFLVKTTAKDGCRVSRTDAPNLDEEGLRRLAEAEHGLPSAHYNAYYHAALLLAYLCGGDRTYLDVGRRGLDTIMSLYPETRREQSETEELCRLILPLSVLYEATGEPSHRAMLDRVTEDLLTHRHPTGGFCEWDTGYRANCSRESRGECSLLTENGDPVADLLYSVNWLPMGFAWAYRATGDPKYGKLWREIAAFCLKAQIRSEDPRTDGSFCRAFDMDLGEAYGCPHDVGWAPYASETGWTDAEILMGLMLPSVFEKTNQPKP